jgi:hypothetical protein
MLYRQFNPSDTNFARKKGHAIMKKVSPTFEWDLRTMVIVFFMHF